MKAVVREHIERGAVATFQLAEIDLPAGVKYFWDGAGILDHDGKKWIGVGKLGRIEEISQTTEIQVDDIQFILSGVDPDLLEGLDDSVKGRVARVWEVVLDQHFRVIDKKEEKEAELDYQVYAIGQDGKAQISISAHGGLYFLRNRSAAKWGPEEQRAKHPEDSGFDEIHLVEDRTDDWRPA